MVVPYITLDEAKAWLGIDLPTTTYDAILTDLILVGSEAVNAWTETRFDAPQVINGTNPEIKDVRRQDVIILKNWPIITVDAIYLNVNADGSNGALVQPTEYNYDEVEIRFRWMNMPLQRGYLRVDYTWGYATVPARVKLATKLAVEGYYRMRKSQSVGIKAKSKEGESISFDGAWNKMAGLPEQAVSLLADFRRIDFDMGEGGLTTRNT